MVCKPTVASTQTKVMKVTKKIAKGAIEKKKKTVNKPIDMEFCALRNLVPGSGEKSDLEVVLDAINYIQSLENRLRSKSSPDLLKAQFMAIRRMNQQQCEY